MDIFDVINKRYSCRSYESRPIEKAKLERVLEAARMAPSASNRQDWRFVVVTDAQTRSALEEAASNQAFVGEAPAVIVACSNSKHVMACGHTVGPIDVSIALEHIALQATDLGLATCWIGAFSQPKVKAILSIPDEIDVIQLMPLGYPADKQKPPKREPIENIVCCEKWQF